MTILLNSKVEVKKSGKVYIAAHTKEIDGVIYYCDPELKEGYQEKDLKVLEESQATKPVENITQEEPKKK